MTSEIRTDEGLIELLEQTFTNQLGGKIPKKIPKVIKNTDSWRIIRVIESLKKRKEIDQGPLSQAFEKMEDEKKTLQELLDCGVEKDRRDFFRGALFAFEKIDYLLDTRDHRLWLECGHEGEHRLRQFSIDDGKFELISAWCHSCKEYRKIAKKEALS